MMTEKPRGVCGHSFPVTAARFDRDFIQTCDRRVEDGAGYLSVDDGAAMRFPDRLAQWQAEARAGSDFPPGPLPPVRGEAMFTHPDLVRWEVRHLCGPAQGPVGYPIAISEIRTASALMGWTAHLWAKGWLQHTDWDSLLRRVTAGLGD